MTGSADLLRRAALKLRQHAEAADFPDGWAVNLADSEVTTEDGGMMIADTMELTGERPDASYIALMHPPVALALADWLDQQAEEFEVGRVLGGFQPRSLAGAMATARAVLREPEETRGA